MIIVNINEGYVKNLITTDLDKLSKDERYLQQLIYSIFLNKVKDTLERKKLYELLNQDNDTYYKILSQILDLVLKEVKEV